MIATVSAVRIDGLWESIRVSVRSSLSLQKIVVMALLQVRPAHDPDPFVTVIVRAAVNQSWIDRLLPCKGRPPFQAGKEIRCHGPAGFDLQRHEPLPLLDDQIHLHAVAVPPEIEGGPLGAVEVRLHQLSHHKGFKEVSPQRVGLDLLRCLNAQQPRGKADIVKIELRRLDQPLVELAW